ncbi:Lnk3-like isoform x1 [Thalictrum thalictroides]|uniref:Lnk3-like isoform x1 n=1 Tax=Thalictrum thalictroides TaxID=46969 RepID=A0A7J6UV41_THATH|nr:Lnk3-like isoform x1 [Thalictrum thalictroides]
MVYGSSKRMDWHSVPVLLKDREPPYGFTAPDYLLQQIATTSEYYGSSRIYSVEPSQSTIDELSFNMQGLSYEVNKNISYPQQGAAAAAAYGLNTLDEFPPVVCGSRILETLPPKRTGLLGDVLEQLDGLGAINQTDNIFLNSRHQKVTPQMKIAYQTMSPQLDSETPVNNHLTDMMVASQLIPFEQSGGISESGLNQCFSSIEVPDQAFLVPNEASTSYKDIGDVDDERSLEEMVLQDFELVIRQMPRKTQICFRDAFYRFAKYSKEHMLSLQQNREITVGVSPPSFIPYTALRYGGKSPSESETNAFDRTIANLLFNELKHNEPDLSCIHV